ncbi:MAG: DUF1549 domain-containing protein [Bryobacterales bacterium]|nr:DUF1549 domain-containing protein [Bryobacterales bacterium]
MLRIPFRIIALLAAVPAFAQVDFTRQIHPLLVARCTACHTGEKAQGGLALNTRAEILRGGNNGAAAMPGKSAASLLIQRVTGEKTPRMPAGGEPLSTAEIDLLRRWIDEGAKGPEGAAKPRWTPPLEPRQPVAPHQAANVADAFLNVPGQPVSDALFARRVYLDLWGLLPTPEQLRKFETDRDPQKRRKLIDQLLAHEENYTGHFISFWNDLLRNDDGVVYYGERKSITPWLRKALTENMPYDRFVATLLNPTPKTGPEGFILGVTWRGEVPASERPPLQAAQNSAQTFLGINLKCNSCHDSFISSWKLKDAYGLASFFSPEPLELVRCDVKMGEMAKPKFLYPELGEVKTEGTLEERRAEAARMFTMKQNGRFARTIVNRYWKLLFGRAIVEPVDDMSAEPWNADLLDALAWDFAGRGYDLKHLLRTLMNSRAYQLPSIADAPKSGERYTFRGPHSRRLTAEQYADAIASITGDWRYKPTNNAAPTRYVREWELKSSSLTRALGRPNRDQVVTERLDQPTTLQSLELVNGQYLAHWLREGARRLVENPPPAPENLFDSGIVRRNAAKADISIKGAKKLYLIVENVDSYDPKRVVAMWKDAVLVKGKESTPLRDLLGGVDPEALQLPATLTVDLTGRKFDRLQATATVAKQSMESDIGPAIRFFIFDREPDRTQMVRVVEETPVARLRERFGPDSLVTRVYRHALQRDPAEAERRVAASILGDRLGVDAVEDFLWMVLQSPEFQYIR